MLVAVAVAVAVAVVKLLVAVAEEKWVELTPESKHKSRYVNQMVQILLWFIIRIRKSITIVY